MDPASASAAPPPPAPWLRRNRAWVAILGTVAVLLVAAGVTIRYGPQLVARQVVVTYLDGLNIDTSGVETLRLRPLRGELSFGPVTFRGADAQQGQVGQIGVKVDVTRLLHRQALVEAIVIEGVRFEVRQAADGSFSLNGIPLNQILAEQTTSSAPPPAPEGAPVSPPRPSTPRDLQEQLGWGAGLDLLEIRDSRVVFIDARGGEAVMHVNQLELAAFRTWAPDNPGRYRLDAELNEIGLTASGVAKPFADKIEIEAQAAVSGVEVAKIERFLGPLGFTSRGGTIDLAVQTASIGVFTAGRIDGRLAATGSLSGVDLAHPLFGSGQLATGTLRLDNVAGSYDASRQTTLQGDLGIDLQASALRFENGTEVGFSQASFGLPGTTVRTVPGQQPEVNVAPQLEVADLRLGGPEVRGSIGRAAARLSGFSIAGTDPGSPFLATGALSVERINLLLPQAEPVSVTAERVNVDLAETRLAFPPGHGARVQGGLALDTRKLLLSIQPPATAGRPAPAPARIEAGRLNFHIPMLGYEDDPTAAGLTVRASDPLLFVEELRLGGPAVQGGIGNAAFRLSSFAMTGAEAGAPMVATGSVVVDRVDLRLPGVEPVALGLASLRAELAETRVALARGTARLAGGFSLDVGDLLFSIQEQARRGGPTPPPTRIEAATVGIQVPKLTAEQDGPAVATVRAARPQVTLERLRMGGPDIEGTVGNAVIRLSEVDVEAAQPGAPFVATGKIEAQRLDLLVPDSIEPIGIVADTLDADLIGTRFAFPSGRVLIEGGVALDSKALVVSIYRVPQGDAPAAPPIRIFATRFFGQVPRLVVDDSRATGTKVKVATPLLTLDRFRMEAPVPPESTVQVAAPALTLQRVDVDVIDADNLEVSGRGDVVAPNMAVVMASNAGPSALPRGQIGELDLNLQRFSYREVGDSKGFGMQGRIGAGALQAELPGARARGEGDRLSLSGLTLDVADLDFSSGGDRPGWRADVALALKTLAATTARPMPISGSVADISLSRLVASSDRRFALDSLTIGRFDAELSPPARLAAAAPPVPAAAVAARDGAGSWPPADLPTVRIGRVALVDGGQVTLRDPGVSPPVTARLSVDSLLLENVDTTDARARGELRLQARLDDSAISVQGWAEAFQPKPSLALQASIDALSLPTLSPYLGPAIGLHIFRGNLTAGAAALVTAGQLDGELQARLTDVRLADRPGGAGLQFAPPIAVPLSTMIRLLEDNDGSIAVRLPVRGDILSPAFSYSGLIWEMLPRAVRALVSSPVRFVSSAWALATAAVAQPEATTATAASSLSELGVEGAAAAPPLAELRPPGERVN